MSDSVKWVIDLQSKEWRSLKKLKGLVLAIDGIKPDIGSDILFIIREVQTGYVLASKMLDYINVEEIKKLIEEVKNENFRILGVVSDNDSCLRRAIEESLPEVPHQLCQFHFLKQLGKKIKKEDGKLKKNSINTSRVKKKS
ncbi:transposase [Candidatus Uabimicrobium sp. HlEnr_7]|uniref:transposase n=1 Tax=Candidatus Uabimicrobium helgolandensis TaxID=3095367 RepID=UPI0035576C77